MSQQQSTRFPQGSKAAAFGLIECMNIMMVALPKLSTDIIAKDGTDRSTASLFDCETLDVPRKLAYYMDDMFWRV